MDFYSDLSRTHL